MDKIYEHKIEIFFNGKEPTVKTERYNVLAENEEYFVIDDVGFTTYRFKREWYGTKPVLNQIYIKDWSNDSCFQCLVIRIATKQKEFNKVKKRIAKEFDEWLYEKHGKFMNQYSNISSVIEQLEVETC